MQQVSAKGAIAANAAGVTFARLRRTRPIKVVLIAILVVSAWCYARLGGSQSSNGVESFPQPQVFVATPGGSAARINVRAGPGAEFEIREKLDRGAVVTGIARQPDSQGDPWIELANGDGFAKESVLAPSNDRRSGQ